MKNRAIALAGLLFCLALSPVLSAQEYVATPVKVSTERVRLNGKIYLSHPVLERQTLFGIAKAYGVTVEDLYAANAGLEEKGLQTGTTLLIPIVEGAQQAQAQAEPARQAAQTAPQGQSFIEHTVMWYEDLEDIAAQYGVTPEAIMQANGMRSKKVTKRQVLKIPATSGTVLASATPVKAEPKQEAAPKAEDKPVPPPVLPTLEDPVIKDPEMVSAGRYRPLKVDKVKVKKADILPPDIPTIGDPEIVDPEIAAGNYDPLRVDPVTVDPAQARATADEDDDFDDSVMDPFAGSWAFCCPSTPPAGRARPTWTSTPAS